MQREHLTPDFSSIRKLIAKNTFFNFVGQVLPIIAAILGVPILIKYLGTERFGILSILWMLMWYSTMLDLGLGRATTKFVANALARGEFENISKIVWTSVLMQVIIGIALAIVSLFLTPFIVGKVLKISPELISEARTSFYLIFLFTPIILVSTSLQGVLEAYQRFDLINFVLAPVKIGVLILSILGAVLNLKLTGIVMLLIMMRVLMIFTLFALDLRICPALKSKFKFDLKLLSELFSFGGWITVVNIVNPILIYIDRFLIGAILSVGVLAYYTAPFEVVQRLWIIPASLVITLFPAFSLLDGQKQNDEISNLFSKSVRLTFVILFPIVFVLSFFSFEILKLWLGYDFAVNSSNVFKFLAFGILINSIAGFPAILLQGIGRPDITAKVYLGELVLYVPFVSFLIYKFGTLGAGVGWMLRQVVDSLLLYGIVFKKEIVAWNKLLNHGSFSVLSISIVIAPLAFVSGVWNLLLKFVVALLGLVIFSTVAWIKALEQSEREKFKSKLLAFLWMHR